MASSGGYAQPQPPCCLITHTLGPLLDSVDDAVIAYSEPVSVAAPGGGLPPDSLLVWCDGTTSAAVHRAAVLASEALTALVRQSNGMSSSRGIPQAPVFFVVRTSAKSKIRPSPPPPSLDLDVQLASPKRSVWIPFWFPPPRPFFCLFLSSPVCLLSLSLHLFIFPHPLSYTTPSPPLTTLRPPPSISPTNGYTSGTVLRR